MSLIRRGLTLPRLGNWRDELGVAPGFEDALGGLTLVVELPMPKGIGVRRIQDRMLEEAIIHLQPFAKKTERRTLKMISDRRRRLLIEECAALRLDGYT